jgi:hypothetical protein
MPCTCSLPPPVLSLRNALSHEIVPPDPPHSWGDLTAFGRFWEDLTGCVPLAIVSAACYAISGGRRSPCSNAARSLQLVPIPRLTVSRFPATASSDTVVLDLPSASFRPQPQLTATPPMLTLQTPAKTATALTTILIPVGSVRPDTGPSDHKAHQIALSAKTPTSGNYAGAPSASSTPSIRPTVHGGSLLYHLPRHSHVDTKSGQNGHRPQTRFRSCPAASVHPARERPDAAELARKGAERLGLPALAAAPREGSLDAAAREAGRGALQATSTALCYILNRTVCSHRPPTLRRFPHG